MNSDDVPLAPAVIRLQDELLATPGWPRHETAVPEGGVWWLIRTNHRFNSLLWDEEDLARRKHAPDAEIVANKRAIDSFNQARNDAVERIDELLLIALGLPESGVPSGQHGTARVAQTARLNSETAGSMIDRLSILALKARAMRVQCLRTDVDETHREPSRQRLSRLQEQRNDLAACLDALLRDTRAGVARFKVYRQFKMYNDPRYNPALVAERGHTAGPAGST